MGVEDITITEHLDLRGLPTRVVDNRDRREGVPILPLFRPRTLRSIRGYCTLLPPAGLTSELAASLGLNLTHSEVEDMLPLKPHQCLVLLSYTWLAIDHGSVWVDNIYLRRSSLLVDPSWAFISAGAVGMGGGNVNGSAIYATNVTFHALDRRGSSASGVVLGGDGGPRLWLDDCIFCDWSGLSSPITLQDQAVAYVRNTAFMHMRLGVEIADVSFGSAVRFENVTLTNVTLEHGDVVSTTRNDDDNLGGCYLFYEATDDDSYDVHVEPVPPAERGPFMEEFVIRDNFTSDCLFLPAEEGVVLPGCPEASAEKRSRMRAGLTGHVAVQGSSPGDVCEVWSRSKVTPVRDQKNTEWLTQPTASNPWLAGLQQELPPRPPSAAVWPPRPLGPQRGSVQRTSLAPEPLEPPPEVAARILPPLCRAPACAAAAAFAARAEPGLAPPSGPGPDVAAIVALALAAMLVLCLLFVLWQYKLGCPVSVESKGIGGYVQAAYDASCGIERDEAAPGKAGPKGSRFSHATVRIEVAHTFQPQTRTAAAYTRLMHTRRRPGQGSDSGDPEGHRERRPHAHDAPAWAQTEQPWWLTSVRAATYAYQGSLEAFDGIEAYIEETLKPSLFTQMPSHLPDRQSQEPDSLEITMESSTVTCQRNRRHVSNTSKPHGHIAQHAGSSGHAGTIPRGEAAMLSASTVAASDPSALYSADTQSSALTSLQSVASPGVPCMKTAHAPQSPPLLGHGLPTQHGNDDSWELDVCYPQHAQHAQRTQHTQRPQHTQPAQHEQHGQNAQHTQRAQHWQHAQHAWDEHLRSSIDPTNTEEAATVVGAASTEASSQTLRLSPQMYRHSTQRSVETGGYSTLAPATDIGLSATDASFTDRHIRVLLRQLDSFQSTDLFMGRFEMLGPEQRRRGGQAVVQFARGADDCFDYAVKFFLGPEAFVVEAALYAACFPGIRSMLCPTAARLAQSTVATAGSGEAAAAAQMSAAVARFLPQVEAVCDCATDARGRPLPPCIVMEKGESLHDWSDRAQPDLFTALSVLSNISCRLADMHDAGFVHRDLKPANVMWLPRENRWTVIDFGCVARIGSQAPLSFTLAYAAPEVVAAFHNSEATIVATAALDAWSLGVMAFELLTGAPPFRLLTDGRCRVVAQLMGELPLPWEGELEAEVQRRLGAFKGPVLQLLQRDPGRRVAMRRFHDTCTRIFSNRTTVEA